MEVQLGYGNIEIVPIFRNGKHGILLQKMRKSILPVGTQTGSIGDQYEITDNDVVIWFDERSGRVLQDGVHMTIMNILNIET
jgi:hypothetical protein